VYFIMKDLNITFVNYLCKDDIDESLRSIFLDIQNCPYSIEVIVVDNSQNQDEIHEMLKKKYPQVVYINSGGNVGFGKGNTVGFQAKDARYYFALNRDTIIPQNSKTIERLIRFLDEHPKIGCIGPKLLNMDDTLQYSCYRFDLPSILIKPFKQINFDKKSKFVKKWTDRLLMMDFDHQSTRPVDWVLGAAMIVRKEVVDTIGWFDERYFMYLEDADWCHRMWEAGWPVYYVHDIIIRHRYARDSAKIPGVLKALFKNKLARIHFISWVKYIWKWRGNHKYYAKLS
jgi:GT2 family glycosyltransferase